MGRSLAENTRRPKHISSPRHHVRRAGSCEEEKVGDLRLQLSDRNVETKKMGSSPHTHALYTMRCTRPRA